MVATIGLTGLRPDPARVSRIASPPYALTCYISMHKSNYHGKKKKQRNKYPLYRIPKHCRTSKAHDRNAKEQQRH